MAAAVQAPDCIYGWLGQYRMDDLIGVVTKITNGHPLRMKFKVPFITWDTLADNVHQGLDSGNETQNALLRRGFCRAWTRFAEAFLDGVARGDYNSVKHGLRLVPGGFSLAIGIETVPGVPCPRDRMHTLAGSRFGCSRFILEPVPGGKCNFTVHRRMTNWSPRNFVCGLQLIGMSLHNVVNWIRFLNGAEPSTLSGRYPSTVGEFDGPWEDDGVDALRSDFDSRLHEKQIKPLSKDEILHVYDTQGK